MTRSGSISRLFFASAGDLVRIAGGGRGRLEAILPRVDNHAVRRGYAPVAAVSMQKFVFACSATLDLPVSAYRRLRTASVLTLDSLRDFERQHPGGGLFFGL